MCKCIETVFQLAVASFSKTTPSEAAKRNLELLIAQTNKLLSSDVGLESCSVFRSSSSRHHGRARTEARPPPVTYIPVAENKHISMGIFVIREGQNIPLHDHPHMHGLIKCIEGSLKITSYSKVVNIFKLLKEVWILEVVFSSGQQLYPGQVSAVAGPP